MIEEYSDMYVAHDRAKQLNKICGRDEYGLRATVEGWAVYRRIPITKPLDSGYIAFKNWVRQQAYGHPKAVVRR